MIVRYTGAILGLLAFSVAILGGLWVGNPVTTVLSRAIWSLVVFCILGLVLGAAARAVIGEFARRRFEALKAAVEAAGQVVEEGSTEGEDRAAETQTAAG